WQQLVRKTLHAAGHRCLDTGEIAPGRAWLGRDHLGPNNEEGRDHDEDNGQLLAHCSRFPLQAGLLGPNALGRCDRLHIGSKMQKFCEIYPQKSGTAMSGHWPCARAFYMSALPPKSAHSVCERVVC